ncbi:MAG: hypothetical protein ABI696_05355 [Rubrivivax sp.]
MHGDDVAAQDRVAPALLDDGEQIRLRAWALEVDDGVPLPQRAEHEAVSVVAAALARGALRPAGSPPPRLPLAAVRKQGLAAAPLRPPAPARAAAAAPPIAPDSTFGSDLDAAAMVAALTQAARDGTPFCEECAKASAAPRDAAPAPPTS